MKQPSSDVDKAVDAVDTDLLNGRISYLALNVLREHDKRFTNLDLSGYLDDQPTTALKQAGKGLHYRPPCRWESHFVEVDSETSVSKILPENGQGSLETKNRVEVIFDVGHNPAAVNALSKRIKIFYSSRPVR